MPAFLHQFLTILEAAVAGETSDREEQLFFNLMPQSRNRASTCCHRAAIKPHHSGDCPKAESTSDASGSNTNICKIVYFHVLDFPVQLTASALLGDSKLGQSPE